MWIFKFIHCQYNNKTNTIYYSQVRSEYYIHTRTLHCMYMSKVFFLPQRWHSLHLYSQDMADKCYNHLQTILFRRYICQEYLSNRTIKLYWVQILKYIIDEPLYKSLKISTIKSIHTLHLPYGRTQRSLQIGSPHNGPFQPSWQMHSIARMHPPRVALHPTSGTHWVQFGPVQPAWQLLKNKNIVICN